MFLFQKISALVVVFASGGVGSYFLASSLSGKNPKIEKNKEVEYTVTQSPTPAPEVEVEVFLEEDEYSVYGGEDSPYTAGLSQYRQQYIKK